MLEQLKLFDDQKYILMSLREENFSNIMNGTKLYEYRTRYAREKTTAFIYISKTRKEIVGLIEFDRPIKGTSVEISKFAEQNDGGNFDDFINWLDGRDCYAIPILKVILIKPISLDEIKGVFPDFCVPQSYYNLNSKGELLKYLLDRSDEC